MKVWLFYAVVLVLYSGHAKAQLWQCDFDNGDCNLSPTAPWTLSSGGQGTPSQNTGPSLGQDDSPGFIFTEGSDLQNDGSVDLTLPSLSTTGEVCLDFYFHMYGAGIGRLSLFTQEGSDSSSRTRVWSRSGQRGDFWIRKSVTVDLASSATRIGFTGQRDSSYASDIALDSISITSGFCSPPAGSCLLSCEFEPTDDCDMYNEGDVDWDDMVGSTPSGGTGPSGGYLASTGYNYMEATDIPPRANATLRTATIRYSGPVCVSFAYHMYGSAMGALSVFAAYTGGVVEMMNVVGDQGNTWRTAESSTNIPSSEFTVIFNAMRGSDYQSDIAIDSVCISRGNCGDPQPVTTPTTSSPNTTTTQPNTTTARLTTVTTSRQRTSGRMVYNCSFERPCSLVNETTSAQGAHWFLSSGGTPSSGTGPDGGYFSDSYIFFETSDPLQQFDTARVRTQSLNKTGDVCVEFYYHMYGMDVGALRVYAQRTGGARDVAWEMSGEQGNRWYQARVDVTLAATGDSVGFEGERGGNYRGDIALDNLIIFDSPCDFDPADTTTSTPTTTAETTSPTTTTIIVDTYCIIFAPCDHICVDVGGSSFVCSCHSGFYLNPDRRTCSSGIPTTTPPTTIPPGSTTTGPPGALLFIYESDVVKGEYPILLSCFLYVNTTACGSVNMAWRFPNGSSIAPYSNGFQHSTYFSFDPPYYFNLLNVTSTDMADSGVYSCVANVEGRQESADVSLTISTPRVNVSARLAGGNATQGNRTAGRVEVMRFGIWGTICDDNFSNKEATVVCNMLNLTSGYGIVSHKMYGPGSGAVWIDELNCTGNESTIEQCRHSGWGMSDCTHYEDVAVQCNVNVTGLKLVGGANEREGLVMMEFAGQNGTVCDDYFNNKAASVFCRMLGFGDDGIVLDSVDFSPPPFGIIWLDNVNCTGDERFIGDCKHRGWGVHDCLPDESVYIRCGDDSNEDDDDDNDTSMESDSSYECDFESDDCGVESDDLWSRNSGATPSSSTGPSAGHDDSQWYYYFETSNIAPSTVARFASPLNDFQDSNLCLSYCYHMYGEEMGDLVVTLMDGTVIVPRVAGDQGNMWHCESNIQVPIIPGPNQVVWLASKQPTNIFRGDIAIDDIEISDGQC